MRKSLSFILVAAISLGGGAPCVAATDAQPAAGARAVTPQPSQRKMHRQLAESAQRQDDTAALVLRRPAGQSTPSQRAMRQKLQLSSPPATPTAEPAVSR